MTVNLTTLDNGFRIVTEHMPSLESAAIGIWVNAGARHERAEQNGIAHFLEHMAFKGTKTRSALAIAEAIEDVGGYINAYTSREVTAYYARVLKDDVPLALDVVADILRNPVFEGREIEIERGVILQEIGQALDTPDDIIFDWLQEKAYPDHPLGRTILGPEERVGAFSRDDLEGFVKEHYGPGQMVLAAAGAVDHDALVRAAERLFGDMTPKTPYVPDTARFAGGKVAVSRNWNRRISRWPSRGRITRIVISMLRRSMLRLWAGRCPRGCSRKSVSGAASAIRSSRRPEPMPIPA